MDGQRFIAECTEAGKKVMVWTVNKEEEMMEVSTSLVVRTV
jgi:phosphatidylglycerol phospholipase C